MNASTDNKFQVATQNYAEASKRINAGKLINEFLPKLTNMEGELQANRFHQWLLGLAKERGDPGIDPSMDIPDETMQKLINLDMDLKRARLINLGKPRGSPTNMLRALSHSLGIETAHKVLGAMPGVGSFIKAGTDLYNQHQLDTLTAKHLAPPFCPPAPAPILVADVLHRQRSRCGERAQICPPHSGLPFPEYPPGSDLYRHSLPSRNI